MFRIGVPAAIRSAPTAKQMTIVVPMSGCFMRSAQAAATTSSSGFVIVAIVRTDSGRVARSCAAYSTIETFRSSDGWNWKAPAPIQRVAPLTVTPDAREHHRDGQREGAGEQDRSERADHLQPVPRGEVQQHQPGQPEHHVALEVVGRVARAREERLRRAGRVHHHRPAGEQAQRGGVEDRVLDRALPRHPDRFLRPDPDSSPRDQRPEGVAALLVVAELVEARARG